MVSPAAGISTGVANVRAGSVAATTAFEDAKGISEEAEDTEGPPEIVSACSPRKGSVALIGAGAGDVRVKDLSDVADSLGGDAGSRQEEALGRAPGKEISSVGDASNVLSSIAC